MRPIAKRQSALRYPLNVILGTEASIRLLRVILLSDIPIGVSELARQAALQPSGVARVCNRLEDLGVITAVGRGSRNRQYHRAKRVGLIDHLRALFQAEQGRWDELWRDLRNAVANASPQSAWMAGPFADETDRPDDTMRVTALTDANRVDDVRTAIWQNLLHLQQHYDFSADLRVVTMADLKTLRPADRAALEGVRLVFGLPPAALLEPAAARDTVRHPVRHADLDERSLVTARAVAEKIRTDPSLIERALRYIEQRIAVVPHGERLELEEWRGILTTLSPPRIRRLLLERSARGDRLRQSSPFVGLLPGKERRSSRQQQQ